MCDLDSGKMCSNHTSCPVLISIHQRSYMNRALDNIFRILNRIEKLLSENSGEAK